MLLITPPSLRCKKVLIRLLIEPGQVAQSRCVDKGIFIKIDSELGISPDPREVVCIKRNTLSIHS